jgi:hypothetical protein
MATKSINIDPNILNMNGNKKSRKNNITKKNQLNIPIKNTDIYTLITNRLKNKKSQDNSNINDPFKQTSDPIINIKNDIEYVQQMLQNTKSKKNMNNKTRKSFSYNVDNDVPWGNMKNGLKKTFREWKKSSQPMSQINKSSTIQFSPNLLPTPIPTPIQSPIPTSIPTPIQSTIPTPIPTPIQTPIQTPIPTPIPTPIQTHIPSSQFSPIKQHIELNKSPLSTPPIIYPQQLPLPPPIIPESFNYQPQEIIQKQELTHTPMIPIKINKKIKKTIHNKYKLGKQKNRQIPRVGILLKTPNTRKTIIEECKKLKSEDISQIKTYLRKRGFIKEGSIAPPNVIRELYCSLKTTGDVKNTNKEYTMDDLHSADN